MTEQHGKDLRTGGIARWFRLASCAAVLIGLVPDKTLARATFRFETVDSVDGRLQRRGWLDPDSLFQRNIRAAADTWGQLIEPDLTLSVRIDGASFTVRAGGSYSNGRFLGVTNEGDSIWEPGPLSKVLTGINPGEAAFGYDIVLGFDPSFVEQAYWFDPRPELRMDPVDPAKGDFISVVMHELGHGLGMAGFRSLQPGPGYGLLNDGNASLFDSRTQFAGTGQPFDAQGDPQPLVFAGENVAAIWGSPLPLTHLPQNDLRATQNFYHLGQGCEDSRDLTTSLMNACAIPNGARMPLTSLDRAIFLDLGYPMGELLAGDFDTNGRLDASDIDALHAAIREASPSRFFDLDGNAIVSEADASRWISQIRRTWRGDANLDGEFTSGDLVVVFQGGRFETDQLANWSTGDWNGDSRFDTSDFVSAFADGGFEQGARPAIAVPEPLACQFCCFIAFALTLTLARRTAGSLA